MKLTRNLLLACFILVFAAQLCAITANEVGVVYNDAFNGSEEVADVYMAARFIPESHKLKLSTSISEEIPRQTYDEEIKPKVAKFLEENKKIRALVLCFGVPLKIKETDRNDDKGPFAGRDFAAVDSELATLRITNLKPIDQQFQNPSFNKATPLDEKDEVLIVHRLDGPTREIALGLIEKAILAEAFGCYGESILDTGPAKPAYKQRDDLMAKIADSWKAASLKFHHDSEPAVYDLSTRKEDPLHYNGWYTGNPGKWKGPVRFRTGSLAVHLHSFSASTVRNPAKNWCAPLLNWGATATIGTVYEPYTVGFPYEALYWDRLVKGFTFGEAGVISNQHISWMAVFIGDPLYTPYAKDAAKLHAANKKLVIEMLAAKEDEAQKLGGGNQLAAAAYVFIKGRLDGIDAAAKKSPMLAADLFAEFSFLTKDMGLEASLGEGLKDLNKAMERAFKDIKRQLKKRVNDTEAYDAARSGWKGLPVYEDLEKFHEGLVKDQEKEAEKWLKKAKREKDSNAYSAWENANQAAQCRYVPKLAEEARRLADQIHAANKDTKRYLRTAKTALKNILAKAKRDFKRKPEDAIDDLRLALMDYPPCKERNDVEKALKELRAEHAKDLQGKKKR